MTINNLLPKARFFIETILMIIAVYAAFFSILLSFFFISVRGSIERVGYEHIASMSSAEIYDVAMLIWQSSYNAAFCVTLFALMLYIAGRIMKKKSSKQVLPKRTTEYDQ